MDFSDLGGQQIDFSDLGGERVDPPQKKSILQRGWDALAIPEQKSREGLKMISGAIPEQPIQSRSAALNFIGGVPHVVADTLAEGAPSFISRGAILTAGGAKLAGEVAPLAKMALRSIGQQGEELSGIAPKATGALEAAYKDPSIIFGKGKKAAGALYEAGKAEMSQGANIFKGMYKPEEILDTAKEYIAKGGKLEPAEALTARKAVDSLMKSGRYVKDELLSLRDGFDGMAKASSNISAGDQVYQRGIKAEALRSFFPQNKYGGASAFKLGIMTALENMGVPGKAAMVAISPAVQGATAAGAGIAARQVLAPLAASGKISGAAYNIIQEALKRRRQNAATQ